MIVFAAVWAMVAMWTANPILLPRLGGVGRARRPRADLELFEHAASAWRACWSACAGHRARRAARPADGLAPQLDDVIDPTIEILRPISGIAWIPLALFIFGIGNALPVFIMTYAAFFPILLGTIAGVRGVDRRLVDAARTMGVPRAHDRDARRGAGRAAVAAGRAAPRRRVRVDRGGRGRADRRAERPRLRRSSGIASC